MRRFFLLLVLSTIGKNSIVASPYQRALDLAASDPLEAEALLERVRRSAGNTKLRRAAAIQLFYLRLANGRLVEAYPLLKDKSQRKKFMYALSAQLHIDESATARLMHAVKAECKADGDAAVIGALLEKQTYPAMAYDFGLRLLRKCGVKNLAEIFPPEILDAEIADVRNAQIVLVYVREVKGEDAARVAHALIEKLTNFALHSASAQSDLSQQTVLAEARLSARNEEHADVVRLCASLRAAKTDRNISTACAYLLGFAYAHLGQMKKAHAILSAQKADAIDIDHRLLKLTVAVAVGAQPKKNLRGYMRRASYHYCAAILRRFASEIANEK
ncbi:MAG: hypothetical protein JSR44_11780 [Spirochaetes bacterium]|nr:hypothetical protein [Spirochaetota bacterium]